SFRGLIQDVSADRNLAYIWVYHQRVALSSAILSSLWAPAIYYPLKRWWEKLDLAEQAEI
ncbi:MAG: rod shape-determining protein MreD, partial [Cyanothece sp. SIO1E1]|nr:rod shape-determining protein MreD [Cyanothece sp. SIO1E1]